MCTHVAQSDLDWKKHSMVIATSEDYWKYRCVCEIKYVIVHHANVSDTKMLPLESYTY